jgi:hypothetical protein
VNQGTTSCSLIASATARNATGLRPAITWPRGRNGTRSSGAVITSELERGGVIAELASSNRVRQWVYSQTEGAGGLTWVRPDEMVPLAAS